MTDIHVESWTLNKNGDKQTTATKKNFIRNLNLHSRIVRPKRHWIPKKKSILMAKKAHIKLNFAAVRI